MQGALLGVGRPGRQRFKKFRFNFGKGLPRAAEPADAGATRPWSQPLPTGRSYRLGQGGSVWRCVQRPAAVTTATDARSGRDPWISRAGRRAVGRTMGRTESRGTRTRTPPGQSVSAGRIRRCCRGRSPRHRGSPMPSGAGHSGGRSVCACPRNSAVSWAAVDRPTFSRCRNAGLRWSRLADHCTTCGAGWILVLPSATVFNASSASSMTGTFLSTGTTTQTAFTDHTDNALPRVH